MKQPMRVVRWIIVIIGVTFVTFALLSALVYSNLSALDGAIVWIVGIAVCFYLERRSAKTVKPLTIAAGGGAFTGLLLFGFILLLPLVMNLVTLEPAPAPAPAPVLSKYETGPPDAQEMLELVNAERAKVSAVALTTNPILTDSSEWKSADMAARGYFAHDLPGTTQNYEDDRLSKQFTICKSVSENLARSSNTSQTTVDGWIGSVGHKRAMLDSTRTITGLGVSHNSENVYFITQLFC